MKEVIEDKRYGALWLYVTLDETNCQTHRALYGFHVWNFQTWNIMCVVLTPDMSENKTRQCRLDVENNFFPNCCDHLKLFTQDLWEFFYFGSAYSRITLRQEVAFLSPKCHTVSGFRPLSVLLPRTCFPSLPRADSSDSQTHLQCLLLREAGSLCLTVLNTPVSHHF